MRYNTFIQKVRPFFPIVVIILFGVLAYSNSFKGEFVWDDAFLIKNNSYIKHIRHIGKLFTQDIGEAAQSQFRYYRPFQMLTYMFDYSLWNLNVLGYHITNIIVHISVALCLYWLVTILFNDRLLSFFTSVLFVVHPVHTEVVAYISGRADSLCALFLLLCLIFYIRYVHSQRPSYWGAMFIFYLCALFSRENALILPVLFIFYHLVFRKRIERVTILFIVCVSLFYIFLRTQVLAFASPYREITSHIWVRIPGSFAALGEYIRLLFLPFRLHMEYGPRIFAPDHPRVLGGILISGFICAWGIRIRKNRIISFSLLWFLITLIPHLNLYPLGMFMAEHWIYLPSIGFFLIVSYGVAVLYRERKRRIVSIVILVSLLCFYSFLTFRQNKYWRSSRIFYERTLRFAPRSKRILNNLANIYVSVGKYKKALQMLKRVQRIAPHSPKPYNNIGRLYSKQGEYGKAIRYYSQKMKIDPTVAKPYFNLANMYNRKKEYERAISLYEKAIEISPTYVKAYNNLATVYKKLDREEEAIKLYKRAVEIDPDYTRAYGNLGRLYAAQGKENKAIKILKKAIRINPNQMYPYLQLSRVYESLNRSDEAVMAYKNIIKRKSKQAGLYYSLGNLYLRLERHEEAVDEFLKAIQINDTSARAYYALGRAYLSLGRKKSARDAAQKAIEIDPKLAKAFYLLSQIYFQEKDYEQALSFYEDAQNLGYNPDPNLLADITSHIRKSK